MNIACISSNPYPHWTWINSPHFGTGLFCMRGNVYLSSKTQLGAFFILSHSTQGLTVVLVTTYLRSLRSLRTSRIGQKLMQLFIKKTFCDTPLRVHRTATLIDIMALISHGTKRSPLGMRRSGGTCGTPPPRPASPTFLMRFVCQRVLSFSCALRRTPERTLCAIKYKRSRKCLLTFSFRVGLF